MLAAVEFVVEIVRNKALYKSLEEGIDASEVKGFILDTVLRRFRDLTELVTEVLDALCDA